MHNLRDRGGRACTRMNVPEVTKEVSEDNVDQELDGCNLLFYLFFTVIPSNICVFNSCRPFVVNTFSTGLVSVEVSSVSRLGHLTEFKSLIIVIVGFQNFVCYLVWAVCLSWSSNY